MYSIEFGHIYLDEYIAMEHVLGKEKLLEVLKYRKYKDSEYSVLNLLDDYNATRNKLDLCTFHKFLNEALPRDVNMIYESDMIFYTPLTLSYLKGKDAKSYRRYIAKFNKFPCSLLAITSYLIRFGIIVPKFYVQKSDKLINILSDRFETVENICKKVLSRSKLKGIEKNIETIYIKGTDGLYKPNA